jgi:hypothetical protein
MVIMIIKVIRVLRVIRITERVGSIESYKELRTALSISRVAPVGRISEFVRVIA